MNYAQKALTAYPLSIPAALLEANLLHELKRDREAIEKMGNLLAYYPDNISLRNQYAHILTRYDLALAQQQFAIIVKQQPQNTEAALALGLIAMERKDNKTATKIFEKLLETAELAATAHFHLGRIAERKNDQQEAIYNYLQVDSGNEFLPATINLLNIFIEKGDLISAQDHMDRLYNRHPEQSESLSLLHSQALINYNYFAEAEKLLSAAINSSSRPNNFLYARAMLFNQRNQPSATERDLRQILLTEPENAIALNSLGYLLSENTARLSEAEELLTKAITLRPNDPVIIDSLGWLHFRQGKFTDALRELRQAYASYQEPAAAAHLGEVLWVTGSQEEARQIWLEGIKLAPTDNTIKSTMKRLKAEQ
jgi:tetratricopeptide (TPR) repeat protein